MADGGQTDLDHYNALLFSLINQFTTKTEKKQDGEVV